VHGRLRSANYSDTFLCLLFLKASDFAQTRALSMAGTAPLHAGLKSSDLSQKRSWRNTAGL
jgi:hypothetical protein